VIPEDSAGTDTAIRVKLVDLQNATPPPVPPNFSAFEGQSRYVDVLPALPKRCCNPSNPRQCSNAAPACTTDANCVAFGVNSSCQPNMCQDSAVFNTWIRCGRLSCTPQYRDWATEFGGDVVVITGDAIVPDSTYEVAHLGEACLGSEASCTTGASDPLVRTTVRWGNVDNNLITNVQDVSRVVDKVKEAPGAFIKPRTKINPETPNTAAPCTALDISRCVDAAKGAAYPFPIAVCGP
jgi:hypothetical protein